MQTVLMQEERKKWKQGKLIMLCLSFICFWGKLNTFANKAYHSVKNNAA